MLSNGTLRFALLLAHWLPTAALGQSASLGTSAGQAREIPASSDLDACPGASMILGFDGSIESGIQWRGIGVQEDYVGAFGQGFSLGPGVLHCMSIWLSQEGFYNDALSDVYVWSGGVDQEPGEVLFLLPDLVFANVPNWPEVGENRVEVELSVSGEFTVGCWGQWPGETPGRYYWATDADGPFGPAWTLIGFDQGFPVGWHHPRIVWGDTIVHNMAMGVTFDSSPVPTKPTTWGRIKALMARQ